MKNKKALIVIIVLFIILAVCGGTFAYVYFATDLLKSNSQMFSKYGTMLDMELYNFFYDADENILLYKVYPPKTLLETLIENNFNINIKINNINNEEIIKILYDNKEDKIDIFICQY